jgi:phosphatidylserine decarboxylase
LSEKSITNQSVTLKTSDPFSLVVLFFHLLPKNFLSWITGFLARIECPKPLVTWLCEGFVKVFRINMEEAEHPISHYASIEDLFTRKLKAGVRPIEGDMVSPADGYLAVSKPLSTNTAVQAKGLDYSVLDLVFGEVAEHHTAEEYAWFSTIYLAPKNYHRVHSPMAGTIGTLRYIPGELWPVNVPFVKRTPRLFTRNERLVFDLDLANGGKVHVVMVGALNVGRIRTPLFEGFATNSWDRQLGARPETFKLDSPVEIAVGQELGTFLLGSTVVLVFDQKAKQGLDLAEAETNAPIRLGQSMVKS